MEHRKDPRHLLDRRGRLDDRRGRGDLLACNTKSAPQARSTSRFARKRLGRDASRARSTATRSATAGCCTCIRSPTARHTKMEVEEPAAMPVTVGYVDGPTAVVEIGGRRLLLDPTPQRFRDVKIEQFIATRQQTVDSGALTSFQENETAEITEAFGNVAHRFSTYTKHGTVDGVAIEGRGLISTRCTPCPAFCAFRDCRPGFTDARVATDAGLVGRRAYCSRAAAPRLEQQPGQQRRRDCSVTNGAVRRGGRRTVAVVQSRYPRCDPEEQLLS